MNLAVMAGKVLVPKDIFMYILWVSFTIYQNNLLSHNN